MILYLDTEFNETFSASDLISLALVDPVSDYNFYEVVAIPEKLDPWVAEHVIPFLDKEPIGLPAFKDALRTYLKPWNNLTVIADWPADFAWLCRSIMLPGHYTVDIPLTMTLVSSAELHPVVPHNALSDAKALAEWHQSVS